MRRNRLNQNEEEIGHFQQTLDFMKFLAEYSVKNRANLMILLISVAAVVLAPRRTREDTDISTCTELSYRPFAEMGDDKTAHDWACQRLLFNRQYLGDFEETNALGKTNDDIYQIKADEYTRIEDQIKREEALLRAEIKENTQPMFAGRTTRHQRRKEYRVRTSKIVALNKELEFRKAELTHVERKKSKAQNK